MRPLTWCAVFAVLLVGCTDKSKKPKKIKTLPGVVKKIDLKANYVAMNFTDPEGKERTLEGVLKEDTDVLINGRAAKLEEVHEGDKVSVSGYREGKDDELRRVVTRVEVTRAASADWKSTASAGSPKPTTQPSKP
jgi:Cu/Ag efflux protein CusF